MANVFVNRHTGSAQGFPVVGSLRTPINVNSRLASSDNPNDGTANPLVVPIQGTNYSWWASFRFAIGAIPVANTITNLTVYTDGVPLDNGLLCAITTADASKGYIQATGTNISGNVLNTFNYPSLRAAPRDITTFTIDAPLQILGSLDPGQLNQDFGDFVVCQMAVSEAFTLVGGVMPPLNLYFSYTEI